MRTMPNFTGSSRSLPLAGAYQKHPVCQILPHAEARYESQP
jgi:hypothetical protein